MKPPAPRLLPDGGTVLITGSGPSLTQADVTYARRHVALTICVNDSYLFAPDAEVLYAGDGAWWQHHELCAVPHRYQGKKYPAFTGVRCSISNFIGAVNDPGIIKFKQYGPTGLSLDPTALATGKNSAYQALNLAVHLGATGAILLGLDMQDGKVYRDGAWRPSDHFFGRHHDGTKPPYSLCLQRFATIVKPLEKIGFSVINCTPKSALTCFPMKPLREVYPEAMEATG